MAVAATSSRPLFTQSMILLCAAFALAGCGGGDGGDDGSNVNQTPPAASQPGSPIKPPPATEPPATPAPPPEEVPPETPPADASQPGPISVGNSPPQIRGTASAIATVNAQYTFAPSATDPDNDMLGFSIKNKPVWASFNTATGVLSGTPTAAHIDTYKDIVITVSDGQSSASLAPFSVEVIQPSAPGSGVTLSWTAPTQNEDGSVLTNLDGYTIVYGPSVDALHESIRVDNEGLTSYVIDNLEPGTYYFGIKSFTTDGTHSALSNVVSKVVN